MEITHRKPSHSFFSSRTLIFKLIVKLYILFKILKENHTLFSGTNPLIGPNKVRQCPASGICM